MIKHPGLIPKLLGIACALLCPLASNAENTKGYAEIIEIKSFEGTDAIYMAEKHKCMASGHKNRYLLGKNRKQAFALALAAFSSDMIVSLNYKCKDDGHPQINGVRVKK